MCDLQSINEESLKHLSAHLEAIQLRRPVHTSAPNTLSFYVRQTATTTTAATVNTNFKLIRISIDRRHSDAKTIIQTLLKSCDLPTDFVDAIRSTNQSSSSSSSSSSQSHQQRRRPPNMRQSASGDTFYGSAAYDDPQDIADRIRKVKRDKTLKLARKQNTQFDKQTNVQSAKSNTISISLCVQTRFTLVFTEIGWTRIWRRPTNGPHRRTRSDRTLQNWR